MKVLADRTVCISAGICVMTDDAVFDQDDDGIVLLRCHRVPDDHQQKVREAVNLCPSKALSLQE
ncbi:MAG TPA: (4Fe-4S)-binding protein [Mycobacterium sp.]|nr:(4Fe-4S)-binding protein [Mycobacterium sp.]